MSKSNRSSPQDRLFERLLRGLAEGQWPSGERLPPLQRLVALHRASPNTLVTVIRRMAALGLVETRPRQATTVCSEAQHRARELLLRLQRGRATTRVAILFPDCHVPLVTGAPYFYSLAQALTREAARHGMTAECVAISAEGGLEQVHRIARRCDLAFGLGLRPENLGLVCMLAQNGLPLIVFNRDVPGIHLPCLRQDDYSAARKLVTEFADRGHRDLCLIGLQHYELLHGRHSRIAGWIDALQEVGLLDGCSMPVVEVTRRTMRIALDRLLRNLKGITALVIPANIAGFLHRTVTALGLEVPRDLSVATTGWVDPQEWPADLHPPLTTVDVDERQFARLSVEMIERVLTGETDLKDMRPAMNIHLTESLGPAPQRTAGRAPRGC